MMMGMDQALLHILADSFGISSVTVVAYICHQAKNDKSNLSETTIKARSIVVFILFARFLMPLSLTSLSSPPSSSKEQLVVVTVTPALMKLLDAVQPTMCGFNVCTRRFIGHITWQTSVGSSSQSDTVPLRYVIVLLLVSIA